MLESEQTLPQIRRPRRLSPRLAPIILLRKSMRSCVYRAGPRNLFTHTLARRNTQPSLSAHFIPLAWRDWSAVIIGNKKWHRNSRRRRTDRSIALISALYGVMVLLSAS